MVYFSNETRYLLNFFNSIEKIYVKKNKNIINTSINEFLNLIFIKLKKIKEEINVDIDGKIIKYSNKFCEKNQLFNYIPENIKKHIKFYSKNIIYYFLNNNDSIINKQIKIYFIIEESEKKILIQEYNKYVKRILCWFYLIKDYINSECCKTLNVYIFMTSLNKMTPNKLEILDYENVNTGITTSCPKNGEIILFRKEEWFKVFIHETFHSFGIDFSSNLNNDNNYYSKELTRNIFKVNSIINLYEAYTEFWAEIFNILFFSYDIVKYDNIISKNKDVDFIKVFHYLINNEIKFSIFQMIKILQHMDLTYDELIKTTEITNNKYKEKTNIMAYYILKVILLYNYNYFIYWCIKNNNNIIKFDEKNKKRLLIFISNYYNNNKMLKDIKEMQKNIKKINNNMENQFLLKTLRISIYD
jgi:hypothetical protein